MDCSDHDADGAAGKRKFGDSLYRHLCESLESGRLAPGERLKIRNFAKSLDTSVTPARDAIVRLIQDEGLASRSA